jgi:hypothetical protein
MYADEKTVSATKTHAEFDPIEYGLIAGAVFVVSTLILAAILLSKIPGF